MKPKHAYLIMVHKSLNQVVKLCQLLDHEENDLYIHIDAKVKSMSLWKDRLRHAVSRSRIVFVPSVAVNWGGVSQIEAELNLLRTATDDGKHIYYHLISGADLPLRSQETIHNFFESHSGKEFVQLGTMEYQESDIPPRVKYWFLWQEYIGNAPDTFRKLLRKIQNVFLVIQRMLDVNINRSNEIHHFYGGPNWFSITDSFARYVLEHENWIYTTFKHGRSVDEVFLQTLLLNSSFAQNRYLGIRFDDDSHSIMRDIDWNRGKPYVWRSADFNELMSSDFLFARKFDEKVDSEIIDRIYRTLIDTPTRANI